MRPINLIVLHCTATPVHVDYPVEVLEKDHIARGFSCGGYHFYVRRDGTIFPMRHIGMVGAHTRGHNRHSIAICYEGGLNKDGMAADTRTEEQKDSLLTVLEYLREKYPEARICGHRDLSPDANYDGIISPNEWVKGCPGFDAEKAYASLNSPHCKL